MARKPQNAMTEDEIIEMQEQRSGSRIYKQISDEHKKSELSTLTECAASRIKAMVDQGRLELTTASIDDVANQIDLYFQCCAKTSTIPSFECLAHALGYSRSGLYYFIDHNPNSPIKELLEATREEIASVIDGGALLGNLAPAPAIFILKSIYGRREQIELIASQKESPLGTVYTPAETEAYIKSLQAGLCDD